MRERRDDMPPAVMGIVVLNIVLFFICELQGGSNDLFVMEKMGALYVPDLMEGQYWRLFSSMFLHFGFPHLMSNMISLFAFGGYMERAIGKVRLIALYLLGGLCGSLTCWAWDAIRGEYALTAGASGAVFALMGGLLILVLFRRERTAGISPARMIFAVLLALSPGFTSENISMAGHVGGLIGGCLVMALLLLTLPRQRRNVYYE